MNRRSVVADVIEAFHHLVSAEGVSMAGGEGGPPAVLETERAAIAQLLGFTLLPATRRSPATHDRAEMPRTSPAVTKPRATEPHPSTLPAIDKGPVQALEVVAYPSIDENRIELPVALARPRRGRARPALEPLFNRSWSRAIAARLMKRAVSSGELDVARIVDSMARLRPSDRLPRRARFVSAPEVTLVVDQLGTMPWFDHDVNGFVRALETVNAALVTIVRVKGAPELAPVGGSRVEPDRLDSDPEGPGPSASAQSVYVCSGGRVIVLSDFGAGDPWRVADSDRIIGWITFSRALAARGASFVAVTPVAPARIEPALTRSVPCVYWDGTTTPSFVHRLLRDSA